MTIVDLLPFLKMSRSLLAIFCVCLCFGWSNLQAISSSADTIALVKTRTGGLHFESGQMEKSEKEQEESKSVAEEEKKKVSEQLHREVEEKPLQHNAYVAYGVVKLLFDNVTEPFSLYYDGENKRSRVDYGTSNNVRTLQLGGDLNKLFRIEFPTHESATKRPVCIEMEGTRDRKVRAQKAFPRLDKFHKVSADKWTYEVTEERKWPKKHIFTLWTEPKTDKPLRLEVVTRKLDDNLITDRYEIDYQHFYLTRPTDDVFEVPSEVHCHSIVGNEIETGVEFMGGLRRRIREERRKEKRPLAKEETDREWLFMNPIANLVDPEDHLRFEREIDRLFENYKRRYNKKYESEKEPEIRRAAFCHNFRFVNLMNRAGLSFRLGLNHLADRTNDELRKRLGFKRSQQTTITTHGGQTFDHKKHNIRKIRHVPSSIDWRLFGAVTPVVHQHDCGSDWAIVTTSVVESALFLRTNRLIKLSAQELLDCSHDEGNHDCKSGEDFRAYEYILKNGLASESAYPLSNRKGECRLKNTPVSAKIKHWVLVSPNDENELKRALAMNGPVAVAMDASHKSFFFYKSGIYHEPNCRNLPSESNHAVLLVGYGQLNGRNYFILQNSFSTDWGQSGYMLIEAAMNHCGLLNTPTFVTNE